MVEDVRSVPSNLELSMNLVWAYDMWYGFEKFRQYYLQKIEDGEAIGGNLLRRVGRLEGDLYRTIRIIHNLELELAERRSPLQNLNLQGPNSIV